MARDWEIRAGCFLLECSAARETCRRWEDTDYKSGLSDPNMDIWEVRLIRLKRDLPCMGMGDLIRRDSPNISTWELLEVTTLSSNGNS